jgi:hypothetical protein
MDNNTFNELIAQVRGTTAELAQAEQKVAAFTAELAQQEHGAQCDSALQRLIGPLPKQVSSGWLPAMDTPSRHPTRPMTRRGSPRSRLHASTKGAPLR